MSKWLPSVLQVTGAGVFTVGVGLWNYVAGLIVGGALMTVFGVALERSRVE